MAATKRVLAEPLCLLVYIRLSLGRVSEVCYRPLWPHSLDLDHRPPHVRSQPAIQITFQKQTWPSSLSNHKPLGQTRQNMALGAISTGRRSRILSANHHYHPRLSFAFFLTFRVHESLPVSCSESPYRLLSTLLSGCPHKINCKCNQCSAAAATTSSWVPHQHLLQKPPVVQPRGCSSYCVDTSGVSERELVTWRRLQKWCENPNYRFNYLSSYDKDFLDRVRAFFLGEGDGCAPVLRDGAFVKMQYSINPAPAVLPQTQEQVMKVNCNEHHQEIQPPAGTSRGSSNPGTRSLLRKVCGRIIPGMRRAGSSTSLASKQRQA